MSFLHLEQPCCRILSGGSSSFALDLRDVSVGPIVASQESDEWIITRDNLYDVESLEIPLLCRYGIWQRLPVRSHLS